MTDASLPLAEPGSFRDPAGRVIRFGNRIFRTVNDCAADDYEYAEASGFLRELIGTGELVGSERVDSHGLGDAAAGARYVLEHEPLRFVSYPYEWSFAALKAAAVLHLHIQLKALGHGITLSDASAFNVQFIGSRPVFIDTLSFRRYVEGEFWTGHRQFCEQFLNPLLLTVLFGVPHQPWYRGSLNGIPAQDLAALLPLRRKLSPKLLTHVVLPASLNRAGQRAGAKLDAGKIRQARLPKENYRRMLTGLRDWIAGFEPKRGTKTVWQDYAETTSYDAAERDAKAAFIRRFVAETRPALLWDVGCNTGDYAVVALEAGAGYVVGFDADQGALDRAFERARSARLSFQPLYLDATNPSPSQGWAQSERHGFADRARADAVIGLALIHHLAIGANVPLRDVVRWLVGLAPCGVIEFVPKSDPMVQRLLQLRKDIFPDYGEEPFLRFLEAEAEIVERATISASGRCLVRFESRRHGGG